MSTHHLSLSSVAAAALCAVCHCQGFAAGDLAVTNFQPPNLFRVDAAGVASPVPGAAAALTGPAGVASTPDGGVVVCDFNGNRLVRFDAAGTPTTVTQSLGSPIRVVVDRDGSFVVAEISPPRIVRVSASGVVTPLATFSSPQQRPFGVAIDRDGSILFTNDLSPAVRRLDPTTGVVTPIRVGSPLALPQGLALFPDGDIAVIDGIVDAVFRIDRATSGITTWVSAAALGGNPEGIVPNNDGGFFVAQSSSVISRIAQVDAAGGVSTFTQGPPFANIEDCARIRQLAGPIAPLQTGPGGQFNVQLDFGPGAAGQLYTIIVAFSANDGWQLPNDPRWFSLALDPLFELTFFRDVPPATTGFTGVLDANGRATGAMNLSLLPPGFFSGLTLAAQAVEVVQPGPYNGFGIGRFSNVIPLRFQ